MSKADKKQDYPEVGEYIIGTVQSVFKQGAFIDLDEYSGKRGMLPLSEISLKWVRNIRDYVKEEQKVVLIVLGVNPERGHIDLSLRRVTDAKRKEKVQQLKRLQRAEKLLEILSKDTGTPLEEIRKEAGGKILKKYQTVYDGLEAVSADETVVESLGIDAPWKNAFIDLVRKNIKPPFVYVTGYMELKSYQPDGVKVLKNTLKKIQGFKADEESSIEVNYITPPLYKVKVRSTDYKTAERVLKGACEEGVKQMQKKGIAVFHRNLEGIKK